MELSKTEKKILQRIQANLVYGDIGKIANNLKMQQPAVSRYLSLSNSSFSDKVVKEAITLITEREYKNMDLLNSILMGG